MVSGRRTYIDALLKPFVSKESSFYGSGYYFYDLNAKFNHRFSKKTDYLSVAILEEMFLILRTLNVHLVRMYLGEMQRVQYGGIMYLGPVYLPILHLC